MSMITDVSMSPGVGRRSATTNRTLVEDAIDIPPELRRIDPGCCPERGDGCLRADDLPPPQRRQLTNRYALSRDDEAFAAVEGPMISPLSFRSRRCVISRATRSLYHSCYRVASLGAASAAAVRLPPAMHLRAVKLRG